MNNSSYWENRYQEGGTSGEGSIGDKREWKWKIISQYCSSINHVIDVGCGDNCFWEGKDCEHYTGIDISSTIIERNKQKRPKWNYIICPAEENLNISAPIVFCFDVLFHILDDEKYEKILRNLASYTEDKLFIYTWINNPFNNNETKKYVRKNYFLKKGKLFSYINSFINDIDNDQNYQKYRYFPNYFSIFNKSNLELIGNHKYPHDEIGSLFVFKKSEYL